MLMRILAVLPKKEREGNKGSRQRRYATILPQVDVKSHGIRC